MGSAIIIFFLLGNPGNQNRGRGFGRPALRHKASTIDGTAGALFGMASLNPAETGPFPFPFAGFAYAVAD